MNPLIDLNDFPAVHDYTYLNAASVAPMPQPVSQAVLDWQQDLALHGTIHFDEEAETRVFEDLRQATARLLNARPEEIAVASSATEALGSLAWALAPGPGQNVVSADVEFPSVVYPWIRVCRTTDCEARLARGTDGSVDPQAILDLIDADTAVICLSHVEYGSGQRFDLVALARAAHAVGAIFIVDATQSAGAVPIDVIAGEIDALVTGSYKWLCGPFGAAVLYLREGLYERLEPGLVGWRSTEVPFELQADRIAWAATARRFEFSTMAYGSALGMAQAIDYLLNVGIDKIWAYNLALADRLLQGLESLGAMIISSRKPEDRTSIVTARFPGHNNAQIARQLNQRGVIVSPRVSAVRFSPHLYNTLQDIDRALEVLDTILRTTV